MPRIYLIGRADETIAMSDYMAEMLRTRYGAQNVLRGTAGRTPAEFAQAVERDLRRCDVALIVIGPHWLTNLDASGQPWLARPDDPTRIALATALRLGMLIAPVLSEGATMPSEEALPPDLRRLPLIQAFPVRPAPYFATDMTRLYQQINTKLTWRPASWTVATLTLATGILWVVLVIYTNVLLAFGGAQTAFAKATYTSLAFITLATLASAALISATLSIRRKSMKWLWLILGALALTLGTLALPHTVMFLLAIGLFMALLLVFALIGPRRETAYG
ncbi:MAG TPA: hypothetical protein VFN78_05200 [Ktedonobacterales bacterium]|nr:hypothetical protein [Ktedonobacterales bacterium]